MASFLKTAIKLAFYFTMPTQNTIKHCNKKQNIIVKTDEKLSEFDKIMEKNKVHEDRIKAEKYS